MLLKVCLFTFFLLLTFFNYSQQVDSLVGNIKKLREKVVFLTEVENPQLLYYDDYGHYGFRGPEITQAVFKDYWYNSEMSYFINYERHFNKKGKILKDYWYSKGDTLKNSYKYEYDRQDRIRNETHFTDHGTIYYTDYYYSDEGHVNIINYNSENDFLFSHTYEKYDSDDNLILKRKILDDGHQYQYLYKYKNGKIKYSIYSDIVGWEKLKNYNKRDSLKYFYKNIINTFNSKGQIVKHKKFQRKYRDGKPKLETELTVLQEYDGENIIKKSVAYNTREPVFNNYKYNNNNRLIAHYCCSENKKEAQTIKKYTYANNLIKYLNYTYGQNKEKQTFKIKYSYKFDDKGNWVEILKTVDNVKRYKWVRNIEYFE